MRVLSQEGMCNRQDVPFLPPVPARGEAAKEAREEPYLQGGEVWEGPKAQKKRRAVKLGHLSQGEARKQACKQACKQHAERGTCAQPELGGQLTLSRSSQP